ncbi:MAG TPA: ABC transporter permease [Terriglobales bacterium]|nr:ABC transporter permease [Terriglobales bacterium]
MADATQSRQIVTWEIVQVALDSFSLNKIRFALTALGVVIGTASLILVVTIGLTGKQYVLNQIQAIGANMIYAFYEGEGTRTTSQQDFLTVDDVRAVESQVPAVVAATPMLTLHERIPVGEGRERDVQVLGVDPDYRAVRNLTVLAGRFFDDDDSRARNKVAVITYQLASRLYGSQEGALGHSIKISGLPFTIIGTFRETVETFGQSELASESIVVPYTAARYFVSSDAVNQMYFSVSDASEVPRATAQIHAVLQSRHRPESVYRVENLSQLISVADRTADALTVVLLLIATVTLIVSGVGIMNIMLATVTSRTREIGIRKAIGATKWEIKLQFLAEAVLISLVGGVIGTVIGLALPLSVRFLTNFRIPISGLSAIIAIAVSSLVGIIFGTVPATRAAQLDPIESLRYE